MKLSERAQQYNVRPYRSSATAYSTSEEDETQSNFGNKTYESAVADGYYQRDTGGLSGKQDNVRRYWEDQISRYALHQFVGPLTSRKKQSLSRVRILDLGSGAGEGYDIMTSLKKREKSLSAKEIDLLPAELIGYYMGIDISPAMVEQGNATYSNLRKVRFETGDLAQGLGDVKKHAPFDIYFSSYGSLSHINDDSLKQLIRDIYEHSNGSCIFVADLLGKFSFEWQTQWDYIKKTNDMMREYSMSYIYSEEVRGTAEIERFPMRYWGGQEFDSLVEEVIAETGGTISKKIVWDRSVLVGRHMETAEFNPDAQPIRSAVNSLHEFNVRTNLEDLIFDYTPHPDYPELNKFFEAFQVGWDAVVYAAIEALSHWKNTEWLQQPAPEAYPEVVQEAITTIRNVVRHVQWFRMGDPRANVVEPQLGYILRNLEMDFQQGLGAGHGLLAIYQFENKQN